MAKTIFEKEEKKWYLSKTLWVSVCTVGAGILTAMADHLATGGVLTLIGLVNIILRVVTNTELKF